MVYLDTSVRCLEAGITALRIPRHGLEGLGAISQMNKQSESFSSTRSLEESEGEIEGF